MVGATFLQKFTAKPCGGKAFESSQYRFHRKCEVSLKLDQTKAAVTLSIVAFFAMAVAENGV